MVEARTAPMPEQGPQQAPASIYRTVENVAVADTDPSTDILTTEPTLKMEPTLAPELTLRPLNQSTGGRPAPIDIPTQVTIPTVGLSPFNALTPLIPGMNNNTHNLVLNSSPDQSMPNMSPFFANNPAIKPEPESAEKGFTGLQPHAAAAPPSPQGQLQPANRDAMQAAGTVVETPTLQPDTAMGMLARLQSAGKESLETKWYEDLAAQIEEDPEKAVEQIEYFSSSLLVGKETAAARKRAARACPHPLFSPLAAAAAEEGTQMRQHAELVMEDAASTFRVQCFDPRHSGIVMFTEYTSALEACIASESLNMQLENPSLMVSSGATDKTGAKAQYNAQRYVPGPGGGMFANVNIHGRHAYQTGYGQMDMNGMQAANMNGNADMKKGKSGQRAYQGYGYDGMHVGAGYSQLYGTEWDAGRRVWTAYVEEGPRKKKVVLNKVFNTEMEAARARDAEIIRRGWHVTQPLNFGSETTGYMPESGYGDPRWRQHNGYAHGYANASYPGYGMPYPAYYGGYGYGQPGYSPYDYEQDYDQDLLVDNYRRGSMGGGQGLIGAQRKRGTPHNADYVYDVPGAKRSKTTKDKYGGLPTTKYRGVVWDEQHDKWRAQLIDGGHKRVLGYFDMPEDAARAYDMTIVRDNRKEKTNFPPTMYKEGNHLTLTTGKTARGSPAVKVTSQYKGVSWNSACSKWVAVLWDRELKRARHIGSFESEEAAARAYDREAIKMLGADAGLNFRESLDDYVRTTGIELRVTEPGMSGGKGSSQYRGVSWHERSQRWEVRVWGGGKQHFIGSFTDEVSAARAYDKAVLRLRGQDARSRSRMNFPLSDYNMEEVLKEPMFSFANAYPATSSGGGWCRSGGGAPQPEPSYPDSGAEQNPPPRRSGRPPRPRQDDDMTSDMSAGSGGEDDVSMNGPSQTLRLQATPTDLVTDHHGKPIVKQSPDNSNRNIIVVEGVDGNQEDYAQGTNDIAATAAAGTSAPDVTLSEQVAALLQSFSNGNTGKSAAGGQRRSSGGGVNAAAAVNGEGEARNRSTSGRGNLSRKASLGVAAATAALAAVDSTTERSPGFYSGGGSTPVGTVSAFGGRQSSGGGITPNMSNGGLPRSGSMSGGIAFTSLVPAGQTTRGKSSTYKGVSWCEKVRKWRALLWDGTKQRFLGHYGTDLEAAKAYDRALLDLKGYDAKPNFPAYTYELEAEEEGTHRRPVSSSFKGVSFNKSIGKWESRIRYNGRTYIIGSYTTEHEAARAHDCACLCTGGGQPNFPNTTYDEGELHDANLKMTAALQAGGEPADSQQPDHSQGGPDAEGVEPVRRRRRADSTSMNGRPMDDVVNDIQVGVCLTSGTGDIHPVVKEAQLRALQGFPAAKKDSDKFGTSKLQITVDATQSDSVLRDHDRHVTITAAKEVGNNNHNNHNNRTPMLGATGNTPRVEMDGPLFEDNEMDEEPFAGAAQGAGHHVFTLPTPRLNQAGEIVCDMPLDAWEQGLPTTGNLPGNHNISLDPDNHHELDHQQLGSMVDQHAELLQGAGLSDSQPLRLGGKPSKAHRHYSHMPNEASRSVAMRGATPDQSAAAAAGPGLPSSALGRGRSQYRGVTWHVVNNKYIARIKDTTGVNMHCGSFDTQEEAAQAYDIAAIALRGPDQAVTNFSLSMYLTADGKLWPELLDVLSKSSSPIDPVAAAIAGSGKCKAPGGTNNNSQDMNSTDNGHEDVHMH